MKFLVHYEYHRGGWKYPERCSRLVELPKWNVTEVKKILKKNTSSQEITKIKILEYKGV